MLGNPMRWLDVAGRAVLVKDFVVWFLTQTGLWPLIPPLVVTVVTMVGAIWKGAEWPVVLALGTTVLASTLLIMLIVAHLFGYSISTFRSQQQIRARPLHHLGLCWRLQPDFFEAYEVIDAPHSQLLDRSVFGPFCPQCGRGMVQDVGDIERYYRIEPQCSCGFRPQMRLLPGGLGVLDAKLQVYKEAQRLLMRRQAFPRGPCR